MTQIAQLQQAASELTSKERAQLALFLLDSLDDDHHHVSDEEVHQRAKDFETGVEKGMTREEFNRACGH